jgi:16S rRNA G527 N7-methylase RsmG
MDAQGKLLDYLALLHKWNKVYNLTAIRIADGEQSLAR